MKRTVVPLGILIFLILAIRMPLLGIPFERDEGEYAYIAWRNGFGELPYRDWIDQKPPGIFWIYQFALQLPFESIHSVHLVSLLYVAASACALYFLALRFMKQFWALMAAILLALLSTDPLLEGTAANTELFMLLPLILSVSALLSAVSETRTAIRFAMLAGALTGIAATFKQVAFLQWPLLVALYWLFSNGPGRLRKTAAFAAWSAVGAGLVWGLIMSYFLLRFGLREFVYNVFTHNFEYIQAVPWSTRLGICLETLERISPSHILIWMASAAGLARLYFTRRRKTFLLFAGWMVTSMAGVSASGYFFPHYFQQMLPVLCLTAALAGDESEGGGFWKAAPLWSRRAILGIVLVVLPLIVIFPYIFTYSPKEAVQRIYPGNSIFAEAPALGNRLAQITHPDDRVFIFGAEPEILFYARRASATRYIFLFPLYGPYSDAKVKQLETAREVSANQPAAALFYPNRLFRASGSEQYFTNWSKSYLREKFHVDTFLLIDPADIIYFVPFASIPLSMVSNQEDIVGAIFVRNSAAGPAR